MKSLILAALAVTTPFALAQSPITLSNSNGPVIANAGNTLFGLNKATTVIKPPAKPPTKPTPPPKNPKPSPKPAPTPTPAKPVVQSSNSNQNQNANSNANANSLNGGNNVAVNKAAGGAGGSATGIAGGGSAQGGDAAGGSASSGSNSVDASDHAVSNTNVHEIFIPPVVPPTPPSSLAVGNVVVETSACGPLQTVVKIPVDGIFVGLFKKSKTPLGFTEELAPYTDSNGVVQEYKRVDTPDGYTLYGHQVSQYTAILGVAAARNVAAGGGGNAGSWGQAGLGASSSTQRLVTTIILRSCEIGHVQFQTQTVAEIPTPPAPALVIPDVPVIAVVPAKPLISQKHRAKPRKANGCGITVSVR